MARAKQPKAGAESKGSAHRGLGSDKATRVRHLISLDARNVMTRLDARQSEMLALFSRLRDRTPMLSTIQCWFSSAQFGELVELDQREQVIVNGFYECLDELRWYFTYTEDMPSTAQLTLGLMLRKLEISYKHLLVALGPPVRPEGPTVVESVDAEVVERKPGAEAPAPAPAPALPARSTRKKGRG